MLARSLGVPGAALGVVAYSVATSMYEWHLVCRELSMHKRFAFSHTAARLIIPLILLASTVLALRFHEYPVTYYQFALYSLAGFAVYCATAYLLTLTREERLAVEAVPPSAIYRLLFEMKCPNQPAEIVRLPAT